MAIGNSTIYHFNNITQKTYSSIAEKKVSEGDLEGALSFYLQCEKKGDFQLGLYKKIANLYTDLQMFDKSIIYWYKFLNYASKRYKYECYNALGANYYFAHLDEQATHYFGLQISKMPDKEYAFDDVMFDFYNELIDNDPPPIRLVDEQGALDEKKINKAKVLFDEKPESAYQLLNEIAKTSSKYEDALLTLGAFYMVDGEYLQAIDCYNKISRTGKYGDFAINNLFGAYFCQGDEEQVTATFNYLKKNDCADYFQIVKFFHLFNFNTECEKCYRYSKYLQQLFTTPKNYFYMAISAYNCKKYEEASYYFARYYKITGAYYVKYCLEASRAKESGKGDYPEKLRYEHFLDKNKRAELEKQLEKYLDRSKKYLIAHQDEIFDFVEGCFATGSEELQAISADILCSMATERARDFIKNILINPDYSDPLKTLLITALVLMGNTTKTGVVFDHVYTVIQFESVGFMLDKNGVFLNAYAFAFGRISALDEKNLYKLKNSAEELYFKLLDNGNLRKISDIPALSAVIILNAKLSDSFTAETVIAYSGATYEEVEKTIMLIESD